MFSVVPNAHLDSREKRSDRRTNASVYKHHSVEMLFSQARRFAPNGATNRSGCKHAKTGSILAQHVLNVGRGQNGHIREFIRKSPEKRRRHDGVTEELGF